ncbi:MAG: MFS transporter, partial [Thermomicrobiales bacterium]
NARLDQTDAAAQTLGPALGGGLVGLLGAPVAIAVDAVSYLVDAVLIAGLRVVEPRRATRPRAMCAEIREGLAWTYRHRTLGPLAASTHVWFLANGAAMTVLALFALRALGFSAFAFGMLLAGFGLASLIGASCAASAATRIGSWRVVVAARMAYPVAWLMVAIAPASGAGSVLVFAALVLQGLAAGCENANEMGFWQALTPDALLGRVNATRRSVNRTLAALGALLAGLMVGPFGYRPTLIGLSVLFAVAALIVARPTQASEGSAA